VQTSSVWINADVKNATEMRVSINDEADPDADWVPFESRFKVDLLPIQGMQSVTVEFRKSSTELPMELTASALLVLHAPLAPSGLAATSRNTCVALTWDVPEDDPTLAGYVVDEGLTAFGPWSPVAYTDAEEMANASMLVAGLAPGVPRYFRVTAYDILDRESHASQIVTGTAGIGVRRFAGDRTAAAAAASRAMFASTTDTVPGSDYVVIASDSDYVQALAANSLAGSYDASVLVAGKSLSLSTRTEITRLGVHRAFVVGTSKAVSPAVDAALKLMGLRVERVTGSDRYAVAANVARRMSASVLGSREAFVVSGASPSDICALMPIAYTSGMPVIVLKAGTIPTAFKTMMAKTPLDSVTIIGGPVAVSKKVASYFSRRTETERVWGRLAADTAAKLAGWAVDNEWATWDNVSVTNPKSWAMSLNIGAGSKGGLVLLTFGKSLPAVTSKALRNNAESIDMVSVFGGTGIVSSAVQRSIRSAMSVRDTGAVAGPEPPFDPEDPWDPGMDDGEDW
jgi:putative cell wall-binding protein